MPSNWLSRPIDSSSSVPSSKMANSVIGESKLSKNSGSPSTRMNPSRALKKSSNVASVVITARSRSEKASAWPLA